MTTLASQYDTLPDTGKYVVETTHSVYFIDTDAKTFERHNDLENNPLSVDGKPEKYDQIYCEMDYPIFANRPYGRYLRSTPVIGIFSDTADGDVSDN